MLKSLAEQLAASHAAEDAAGVEYRLLLLHTGVEGIVPTLHGLPPAPTSSRYVGWWTTLPWGMFTSPMS